MYTYTLCVSDNDDESVDVTEAWVVYVGGTGRVGSQWAHGVVPFSCGFGRVCRGGYPLHPLDQAFATCHIFLLSLEC